MSETVLLDDPSAQLGSARSRLLTVLGEFVLPAGGEVWTSTLVAAAAELGIGEKNARQAIARIGDRALISGERHGRSVRWSLTEEGRALLEAGAERIYGFGTFEADWDGAWLVAHCPVPESQRRSRHRLRIRLGFLGFGELSPSLFVCPHVDRAAALDEVLRELGLWSDSVVFRSSMLTSDDDVVVRAWDLDALAVAYRTFVEAVEQVEPDGAGETFRALVELVDAWRRFPFVDPELPPSLLPTPWIGSDAAALFRDRHRAWSPIAHRWFGAL